MAQFNSFADYQKRAEQRAARQAAAQSGAGFAKVGFFGGKDANGVKRMANAGDVALVRINYATKNDFMFASYHQFGAAQKYMKVVCLEDNCPLCTMANDGTDRVSKAKDRVFVPMVVAYKNADGTFTTPEAVIWDAPAAGRNDYAKLLANKIDDFGDLRAHVFKITRNGTGLETTYSIDYVPTIDNENIIKNDFTAFTNFKIEKHSYWIKTVDEINTFIATGSFPEVAKAETQAAPQQTAFAAPPTQPTYQAPAYQTPAQPAVNVTPTPTPNAFAAAEANPFTAPTQPTQAAQSTQAPAAPKFQGFSF